MIRLADSRLTLAPLTNFDIGALCSALFVYVALRVHALTLGGALAAFFVGAISYGSLGPPAAAVIVTFFATSVGLSRIGRSRKRLNDTAKQGPRDGAQVLANGGIGTVFALLVALTGDLRYVTAFAGAFAAANADTWGTEIGTLFARRPRSLLTFREVATGLSGGVTLPGTLAEIAGAAVIAWAASLSGLHAAWAIFAGGVAGAFVDSALGASLQALRWCPQCRRHCEIEPHTCGANTTVVRGAAWIGNDAVNTLATAAGAGVALFLAAGR